MEFLGRLEGQLGKRINYLNPDRHSNFGCASTATLHPQARAGYATAKARALQVLDKALVGRGDEVVSYVAIRSDEDYRDAMVSTHPKLQ